MKKIMRMIGIIIALALCTGLVVPTFAANITTHEYINPSDGGMVSFTNAANIANDDSKETAAAPHPLDGAANWANNELYAALENGLLLDDMFGNWTQPALRIIAAEEVVKLLESLTGKTFGVIARENGYDLTDCFGDTINEYANFLKQAGISDGIDGVNFDPGGVFTRAQMVTMLGRMAKGFLGVDTADFPRGSTLFTDVPDWADEFVGWAGAAGITEGVGGGLFDSDGTLQNQHTGVFIWRAFARYYKSPYELLQTGELITIEQMDILKAEASGWQSKIIGIGDFAEIVAIEPQDGSDQQIYIAFRRFDPDKGEFVYENGYEKIRVQMPEGIQARILSAESGAGSGELLLGVRFVSEAYERIELFYTTVLDLNEKGCWDNVSIYQKYYIQTLDTNDFATAPFSSAL